MDTEHLVLDYRRKRKIVEHVSTVAPDVERRILPETLVIEAVHLRNLAAFVIASNQCDAVGISNLVGKQQQEGFDAVEAPVHEVTQEKVIDCWALSPVLKQFQQVIELSVYVPAYGYGSIHSLHVPLLHQNLFCFEAQLLHLLFRYGLAALELLDLLVQLRHTA